MVSNVIPADTLTREAKSWALGVGATERGRIEGADVVVHYNRGRAADSPLFADDLRSRSFGPHMTQAVEKRVKSASWRNN